MAKKEILTALSFVLFGTACFFLGYRLKPAEFVSSHAIRENTDAYRFISPLLAVGRPDAGTPSPQYAKLAAAVKSYIGSREKSGLLDDASVYLINYTKEGSFALNENASYDPASLMKIAIMIAYFKREEKGQGSLQDRLTYSSALSQALAGAAFDTPSELKVGESYSVDTLINDMIIDSDNGAMNLLLAGIPDQSMEEMYAELGIKGPEANVPYVISAKDYSLFFRILYNATYLTRADSEKALSILSQATFKDGLVAGLPRGTTVAHKFGEHVTPDSAGNPASFELHDCGIVYEHNDRYLLCVMTKGKTLSDLSDTIAGIAKMVSAGR